MKKAYLLAFSETLGTQEQVKAFVEKMTDVTTWRYDLPHAFYLISTVDAKTLSERLRELAGDKGRFIIAEITENSSGWLTLESWHLIQHKQQKPK